MQVSFPLQKTSAMSKMFSTLPPIVKQPRFAPKSTARVLTSEECLHQINMKEQKKAAALRMKKEHKVLHR